MALGGEKFPTPSPHRSQRAWGGGGRLLLAFGSQSGRSALTPTLALPAGRPRKPHHLLSTAAPGGGAGSRGRPGGGWSLSGPHWLASHPQDLCTGAAPTPGCLPAPRFSPLKLLAARLWFPASRRPAARPSSHLRGLCPRQAPRTGCSAKGPRRCLAQGRAPPASLCPLRAPPMQGEQGPWLGRDSTTLPRAG